MARMFVRDSALVYHLSWLERIFDFRRHDIEVGLDTVERVETVARPLKTFVISRVDLGWAKGSNPLGRRLVTLNTRARLYSGGRIAVALYVSRGAVLISLSGNGSPYRMLLASAKDAHALSLGAAIREAGDGTAHTSQTQGYAPDEPNR